MDTMLASQLFGSKPWPEVKIVYDPNLTKKEKRNWFERLFSFPWNPFEKYKEVPDYRVQSRDNMLIMHPYWKSMVDEINKEKK